MKISKDQLNNMIKEELNAALANEGILDKIKSAFSRDKPKADGVVGTSAKADTTPIDIKGPSRYSTDRVGIFSQGLGGQAKAADKDRMSNIGADMGEKPEGVIGGGGPTPTAFTQGLSQDEQSKLAAMGLNVAAGKQAGEGPKTPRSPMAPNISLKNLEPTGGGSASKTKTKRRFGGNKPKAGQEAGIGAKAQARKARMGANPPSGELPGSSGPMGTLGPDGQVPRGAFAVAADSAIKAAGSGEKGGGKVFSGRKGDPFQYKEVSPGKFVTRKGTKGKWKDVKNTKAIASIKKVQAGGQSDWKAKRRKDDNLDLPPDPNPGPKNESLNEDKTFDRWKELIK